MFLLTCDCTFRTTFIYPRYLLYFKPILKVTLHNVHFMNRLMASIRRGIQEDCLDEVEREYVHPDLMETLRKNVPGGMGE
jgi:queuine/archaeosine tRNA-ribosyltransferase